MLGAVVLAAAPVGARDRVGVYANWAAFRDPAAPRCFAIAEPVPELAHGGVQGWTAVADWPRRRIRRQLQVHLSQTLRAESKVRLSIGDSRFVLTGSGNEAWAANRHLDAAIVAAMRSGRSMSIESVSARGVPFADTYALAGAASAIDAATLACAGD